MIIKNFQCFTVSMVVIFFVLLCAFGAGVQTVLEKIEQHTEHSVQNAVHIGLVMWFDGEIAN
ncbi:hypothetical protein ACQKP8_24565 [Photobacterium alginatilyticum]|uniref:hypothetical protein n=1 Tax=Photobacterium alginatilyticum TaxID=1775171 RepID=UPI0040681636